MRRVLYLFPLLLFVLSMSLAVPVAQAEDPVAALPPPTEVQDSPEALETVDPPAADNSLSKELNVPESDADVEILSSIREDGTKIEEYSRHGRVYMVKISPPHGLPPYYLYDSDGDGKFERRLLGSHKHIAPPEWVIKRF